MLKFLTFLGGLFALGLAIISIGANFWFGTLLTTGAERWLYGACSRSWMLSRRSCR